MSYKSSQLSPLSTRGANVSVISIQRPWPSAPLDFYQAECLLAWMIYDPELDAPRRINRDVMLGMALVLTISGSFWAGLGLALAQVWK